MFSIIRSGLNTTNQEISIISNNIANANTEGYSKKIADPALASMQLVYYSCCYLNLLRHD